jgi:hypothetical protein
VAPGHDSQPGEKQKKEASAVADRAELAPSRVVAGSQTQRPQSAEEQEGPDDVCSDFDHGPPPALNVSNSRT